MVIPNFDAASNFPDMEDEEADPDDHDFVLLLDEFEEACRSGKRESFWSGRECTAELRERVIQTYATIEKVNRMFMGNRVEQERLTQDELTKCLHEKYRLEKELGRGSHGVVYLAEDIHLKRKVAIKFPKPEVLRSSNLQNRFGVEASLAAGIDHPHVLPIYEIGEASESSYIVSAYCPGENLKEWLKRNPGTLTVNQCIELVICLAEGVAACQDKNILHRDLKPANVMLFPNNCRSLPFWPKLMDFGLAKVLDSNLEDTASGDLIGTPRYMSPEQINGNREQIGPATDVFALGTILYELLANRPPFDTENFVLLLDHIRLKPPDTLQSLNPDVTADLENICFKCLEKSPLDRYQSAAELASVLSTFLEGHRTFYNGAGIKESRGNVLKEAKKRFRYAIPLFTVILIAVLGMLWIYREDGFFMNSKSLKSDTVPRSALTIASPSDFELEGAEFSATKNTVFWAPITFDETKPLTLEAWVRPEYPKGMVLSIGNVLSMNSDDGDRWVGPSVDLILSDTELFYIHTETALVPDVWHHFACVYDGQTISIFIDGKKSDLSISAEDDDGIRHLPGLSSVKLRKLLPDTKLVIGSNQLRSSSKHRYAYHGRIREVRMTSKVLYEQEFAPERLLETLEQTFMHYRFRSDDAVKVDNLVQNAPALLAAPTFSNKE